MIDAETKPDSGPIPEIRQDWMQEATALMRRDHERLRGQWETLNVAIEGGAGEPEVVRRCVETLIVDAREHFRNEEWAMRVTGYAKLGAHAEDHKGMIRDANDMLANLTLVLRPGDWPALATYFRHWIQRHEERYDRTFRQYIEMIKNEVRK